MSSAAPIQLGAQQATSGVFPGRARRANKAASSHFLVEDEEGEVQLAGRVRRLPEKYWEHIREKFRRLLRRCAANAAQRSAMFPGQPPEAIIPLLNGNAVAPPFDTYGLMHPTRPGPGSAARFGPKPILTEDGLRNGGFGRLAYDGMHHIYMPQTHSVWHNPVSTYQYAAEGSDGIEVSPAAGDSPGSSAMHASMGVLSCAAAASHHNQNQVNSGGPRSYEDEVWQSEETVGYLHTVQEEDGSQRWSTDGPYSPNIKGHKDEPPEGNKKDELRQRRATSSAHGTDPVQLVADKGSDWAVPLGVGYYDKTTLTKTIVKAGGTHSSVAMISVARGYEVKVISGHTFSDYSSSDADVYPAGFWALKLEADHMISVRIIRQFRLKIGDDCLKSTANADGTDGNTLERHYTIGGNICNRDHDASNPDSCSHCLNGKEDRENFWLNDHCKKHERNFHLKPVDISTCSQETDGRPKSGNNGFLSELWSYDLDSGRIVHSKSGLCLVASDKDHDFYFTPDYYMQLTLIDCNHPFLWSDSLLQEATLGARSGSRGSFGRWDLYDVQSGSMLKVRGWRGKNPNCAPDSSGYYHLDNDDCEFKKGMCADAGAGNKKVHLWDCQEWHQQWRVSII